MSFCTVRKEAASKREFVWRGGSLVSPGRHQAVFDPCHEVLFRFNCSIGNQKPAIRAQTNIIFTCAVTLISCAGYKNYQHHCKNNLFCRKNICFVLEILSNVCENVKTLYKYVRRYKIPK